MRNVRYDIGDILEMDYSDKKIHRYLVLNYDEETDLYTVVEYDSKRLWLTTLTDKARLFPDVIKKIGHVDISALQETVDNDVPDKESAETCEVCEKAKTCDYHGSAYGLSFRVPWENGVVYDDVNWKFCPECGKRRK